MGSPQPRISVVIPTKDAGPRFAETLRAIRAQEVPGGADLWVVDSGSTDDTVALARAHGAQILTVAPEEFGHGRTRNLAIAACEGRYVALTVQDAIPADGRWLAALVEALEVHPRAAGAYSRHLPHPGASVVARQAAEYWYARLGGPHEQALGDLEDFRRLPIDEKQYRCTFNNVSSMVRREVWAAQPFPDVPYAEDLAWGYAALRAGYTLLYEPASRVYHSHERPPAYALRRAYVEAQTIGEIFKAPPLPLDPQQAAALLDLFETAGRGPEHEQWCGDLRVGYEALFTGPGHGQRIAYLLGERSPVPVDERRWVREHLLFRFARQGGASGQPLPDRFRQRFPYPWDYMRSLDWRLRSAARSGGSHWLSVAEVRALCGFLWDDLGHDYVRLAVLHGDGPVDEVALARLQIAERVAEWATVADAPQELGDAPEDTLQFHAHAAALVVGRRLGQAAIGLREDRWGARLSGLWTGGI